MIRQRGAKSAVDGECAEPVGKPVGRRVVLGLVALGGAGVLGGSRVQDVLARALGPVEARDPTGLIALFPLGNTFRFYSVTGSVPTRTAYRLTVSGLVRNRATYTLADLQAMPQTRLVRDFQCVTGWRVPQVHWSGSGSPSCSTRRVRRPLPARSDSAHSMARTPRA